MKTLKENGVKNKMKFAVLLSTYQRNDGRTIKFLERAIDSVFNQTYQEFKIFLIGDKYENEKEITELLKKYDSKKILFKNLKFAKERDIYKEKFPIWSYGGVNAVNIGIELIIDEGFDYICHLDHDDWWNDNHLYEIQKCINIQKSDWICTKSTHLDVNTTYPQILIEDKYVDFLPKRDSLIHSSVCFNIKTIPLRYVDLYQVEGHSNIAADSYLWERHREYIKKNNLKSTFLNVLTCNHIEEGHIKDEK
jgi:glycosyltransferase involved in cell wall biosynthesis